MGQVSMGTVGKNHGKWNPVASSFDF